MNAWLYAFGSFMLTVVAVSNTLTAMRQDRMLQKIIDIQKALEAQNLRASVQAMGRPPR